MPTRRGPWTQAKAARGPRIEKTSGENPSAYARNLPPAPPPEPDFSKFTNDQLDILKQVYPKFAKQLEILRSLQAKKLLIDAGSAIGRSAQSPERFCIDVLGWKLTEAARLAGYKSPITPDQQQVCQSVVHKSHTAVPSGHGTGKTKIVSGIILWFLNTMKDSIVLSTASTWAQVEAQLWREIRDSHRNSKIPLPGKLLETELRIGDRWFAMGLSTDDPTRFQGFHSKRVLIVFDEATGVREDLWDAAESMILGPQDRFLAIGNPTDPGSRFKRACDSGLWNVLRLDCRNHPNVIHGDPGIIPGAVTREWVADRLTEYGSEDSPLFQARVAGLWPTQGQYSLISLAWIDAAQKWDETKAKKALADAIERERASSEEDDTNLSLGDPEVWGESRRAVAETTRSPVVITNRNRGAALGIDIAGEGSDLCTMWDIEDGRAKLLWWVIHRDLMETVGRIVRTVRDGHGKYRMLSIDDTGIGNGVSSRLLELQRWARAENRKTTNDALAVCAINRVNFSTSPSPGKEDNFHRIKDELWWDLRESLRQTQLGLPTNAELLAQQFPRGVALEAQLVAPIYETDSRGRIRVWDKRVEGREKTRSLPTRSPDLAHGLMLARRSWKMLRADLEVLTAAKTPVEVARRYFANKIAALKRPKKPDTSLGPELWEHLDGQY